MFTHVKNNYDLRVISGCPVFDVKVLLSRSLSEVISQNVGKLRYLFYQKFIWRGIFSKPGLRVSNSHIEPQNSSHGIAGESFSIRMIS